MAERADTARNGRLDKNPFPPEDPRHDEWVNTSLWIKEQLNLFDSAMLDKKPSQGATSEEQLAYILEVVAGRFDIVACGFGNRMPLTNEAGEAFEQFLDGIAGEMLARADSVQISSQPKAILVQKIRTHLESRKKYWTGQVLMTCPRYSYQS